MKINEETTVSEEQVLFNKLKWEEQQFILKQMRMLQPCELSCEIEEPKEHKIPEKIEYHQVRRNEVEVDYIEDGIVKHFCLNNKQRYFADKINEILDYLEELKNE